MPSTNGHAPKRAILYARASTEEQAKSGYSLTQQMEALREYADREGYEVLEQVLDLGRAGRALRGRAWTGCETWCPQAASRWWSPRTVIDLAESQRTAICSSGSSRSTGARCEPSMIGEMTPPKGN